MYFRPLMNVVSFYFIFLWQYGFKIMFFHIKLVNARLWTSFLKEHSNFRLVSGASMSKNLYLTFAKGTTDRIKSTGHHSNRPIHWAPPRCVLTNRNVTKVSQIRSDMRVRIMARAAELCRKALESTTCSSSHVRCGRSLLDRCIAVSYFYAMNTTTKLFFS